MMRSRTLILTLIATLPFVAGTSMAGTTKTHTAAAEDHQQHSNCPLSGAHAGTADDPQPTRSSSLQELGQDSFAAVSEMVSYLETDPSVDWSSVRLDRLREHLIDMDLVMSRADVETTDLPDGFRARVSSDNSRTAAAIGRMVPAHGRMMDGHRGWRVEVTSLDDSSTGVLLEVRASDPDQVEKLRALGFAGFLVAGDHHRPHHLAMTLGSGH